MSVNTYENIENIFNPKDEFEEKIPQFQNKVAKMYGSGQTSYNPFLDREGNLFNKHINYQDVLNNPNVTKKAKEYITQATGLTPTENMANASNTATRQSSSSDYMSYTKSSGINSSFQFNANADENTLASLDVKTELPKLSTNQIEEIISKHFSKSTVIKPSDAEGIYNAQQQTGMSALAILGIGALESGYGTSNIAKQKNNIWGWNATNVNPSGNATTFSQMSQGALEFANKYLNTYYDKYGAKSIYAAGTGNNPAGKGYAYNDNGSINSKWATDIGSIMKNFYQTAKTVTPQTTSTAQDNSAGNNLVNSASKYIGSPYVWGGDSMDEGGFDCSGFIYAALRDAGYNVNRTTAEGYRQMGTSVDKSDLQPGDLVFYGRGQATHVGVYIGNGQVLQSSGDSSNTRSNPGKGVCVKNLDYRSDYLGAKRYSK